jgi:hypothetical protein
MLSSFESSRKVNVSRLVQEPKQPSPMVSTDRGRRINFNNKQYDNAFVAMARSDEPAAKETVAIALQWLSHLQETSRTFQAAPPVSLSSRASFPVFRPRSIRISNIRLPPKSRRRSQ